VRILGSIRARFTGWYLVVLAVLLALLSIGLYLAVSATLHRDIDRGLVHRSEQLAATHDIRRIVGEGRFEQGLGELVAFYTQEEDGFSVVATRAVESFVDEAWIEAAFGGTPVFANVEGADGQPIRLYVALFRPPGAPPPQVQGQQDQLMPPDALQNAALPAPAVAVVGRPMDIVVSAIATLRTMLLIAVPLTLLLSAGGGLFLVRRALEPVDRMIETTREIEETDLASRVDVESNDELGRLAGTLNAMLARLEGAFRRQRQFTDDASHELRSPLSVIEAEATLALRRERSADDYRDALGAIADEARTMNRLVDQLLTLARSDSGDTGAAMEPVDLTGVVAEAAATLDPIAEERGLKLHVSSQEGLDVEGDPIGLRRLVANLIQNAIQHTDSPGTVTVAARRTSAQALITVADTGTGIPVEHLPHIFKRFYRADDARSRDDGGSGLGLAICQAVAEAHGGSIDVESRLGEGSRFTVRLPLRRARASEA